MKATALLCVAAGVAMAVAAPQDGGGYGYQAPVAASRPGPQYSDGPAQYNFQWDVNDAPSGNFYGHQEQRDGPNTQGSYYVRLPDTRLMRVEYYVDETGYHPTITFEGEAQYPSAPSRTYTQPAPAPAPAPSRQYTQPAPAPAPAPSRQYTQPAPAPAPAPSRQYTQPAPVPRPPPSTLYSAPGK